MNYAISSDFCHFSSLETTSRKRATKHSLIHVEQGLMLCRLGKVEYAVEAGQSFWIPLECLNALTFFPNTTLTRVDFSVRLQEAFPHQAGYIQPNDLSLAIIKRLKNTSRDMPAFTHLTQLLKIEAIELRPQLAISELSHQISDWQPQKSHRLAKEMHMVLTVREAIKRHQSGAKRTDIIADLFNGDEIQFTQWMTLISETTL
ncbi:AraC family transcriptional regulator [Vibrio porteresiae]|uniref:AraC family transcriptional regulator n=1 Tax=Vibrio porteresiae DSM 19223 TaxID=1123496 RepID=A0ABZ0QFZ5_9VIBR|nr:AraC family transcriptional regulator [Vibrio porteresiae]WPC75417.1 AraC family transcriptional regulator [Vibrio porteresiae DSM 19223]